MRLFSADTVMKLSRSSMPEAPEYVQYSSCNKLSSPLSRRMSLCLLDHTAENSGASADEMHEAVLGRHGHEAFTFQHAAA
jgi:hypothetical protein